MKRLHSLSLVLLCSTFATYPVVAMEENSQTCDASCSSSSQTNKSTFAPSHTDQGTETMHALERKRLQLTNLRESPLLAMLPHEIIRTIVGHLNYHDIVSTACASQTLKDILYTPTTTNTNLLDLKSRFFAVAKKLKVDPETFWNNWVLYRKIDFSYYRFENRTELEKALLTFMCVWHEIKELNFAVCNITEFPQAFETLAQLDPQKYPTLRNTQLQLPSLTTLDLSSNYFTLSSLNCLFNMLPNLPSLKELMLSCQGITQLPGSFNHDNLKHLTKLMLMSYHLDTNSLSRLFSTLQNLLNLKEIQLWFCNITQLPDSFNHDNLKHLTKLDLTCSKLNPDSLNRLFSTLPNLPTLKELILSSCGIKQLPDSFNHDNLKHLTLLDLNNNNNLNLDSLNRLFTTLSNLSSLKTLSLYLCGIKQLPNSFNPDNLKHLTNLNMGNNELNLDSLNRLFNILPNLPNLTDLNLYLCGIKQLPDSFNQNNLKYLTHLDLGTNKLTLDSLNRLFTMLLNLSNLKVLKLYDCGINQLPDFFNQNNFKHLTHLNLGGNQLNLDSLNQLFTIIAHLPLLKEISLSNCGITQLPASFNKNNLKYLTKIDLHFNRINNTERERILSIFPGAMLSKQRK
jgi:Leucine-rich repeat (LRR) protein